MDMRRRLVLTIAGVMTAAVVVVGLGTLALTTIDARREHQRELERRVDELAGVVAAIESPRAERVTRRLQPVLDVDTLQVIRLDISSPLLSPGDVERLRAGETVAGRQGGVAHAAAPLTGPRDVAPTRALLATDDVDLGLGPAARWFLLASVITVLLGGVVARRLARTLTGPLADAEATARRIAGGDLSARIDAPHDGDDELGRLVGSINAMAASLESAQGLERDFLLSVSHDLRTPLTSISGWGEALADGTAPDPAKAGGTILSEAGRLDRLVRDLLDLARLRARSFKLTMGPVDLRDVAAGAAEGLRPELEDADLLVRVAVPDEAVVVQGDADRLAQIAANLIENAGRHASHRIRVSVEIDVGLDVAGGPGGRTAVLAVEDDGQGIPPTERPRIFERMYAGARPAARVGGGTGLGLTIVRELARAMDGDAVAGEAGDGGARFEVRLPLAAVSVSSASSTAASVRVPPADPTPSAV
jgi:two-component system sensor histidine kinase BaeS